MQCGEAMHEHNGPNHVRDLVASEFIEIELAHHVYPHVGFDRGTFPQV